MAPEIHVIHEGRIESESAARFYAGIVHAGDVDKAGNPYVHHLLRVSQLVESETDKIIAWLHDVLEDHPEREADLKARVDSDVWACCIMLTHTKEESYQSYIAGIYAQRNITAEHQRVYRVKVADICDHLRAGCPQHLAKRYLLAMRTLHGVSR